MTERRRLYKPEVARNISKLTDIPEHTVNLVIQSFLDSVVDEISKDNIVSLRNFGKFYLIKSSQRRIYDINTKRVLDSTTKPLIGFAISNTIKKIL